LFDSHLRLASRGPRRAEMGKVAAGSSPHIDTERRCSWLRVACFKSKNAISAMVAVR
jgi:hypothetical protein